VTSRAAPIAVSYRATPPRFVAKNDPPTVLVITNDAISAKGIRVVQWGTTIPNLSDYDATIIDVASLSHALAKGRQLSQKPEAPNSKQVTQLLQASGLLIVIIPPKTVMKPKGGFWTDPYWWSPIPLENVLEEGTSRFFRDHRFRRYFERGVETWRSRPRLKKSGQSYKNGSSVKFGLDAVVASRSDIPVAGLAYWELWQDAPLAFLSGPHHEGTSGPVFIVPEPDRINSSEAIKILLQDVLAISVETPRPTWIRDFPVPGTEAVEAHLLSLVDEAKKLETEIGQSQMQLSSLQGYSKLLYADGEELERASREALIRLGAEVNSPITPGYEDLSFEFKALGRKAVMEIKGRQGPLKKDDIRQAEEWVSRWFETKGETIKGILFGNPYRTLHPRERPDPWTKEIVEFARAKRLALITTTQLYDGLVRVERKELSSNAIFEALLDCDGPFTDLP